MYVLAALDVVIGVAGLAKCGKNGKVDGGLGAKRSTPVHMMYVLWG